MASVHTAHATYYLDVSLVSQNQGGNYSTIRIHFYAIADSGWSGFANGIGWSLSTGHSGAVNFNGTSIEWVTVDVNVAHDANGYASGTISAHSNATGTSTYGGPVDIAQGFSLPRIPKVPGAPSLTAVAQPGLKVDLNVGIPAGYDEGGSSVQYLWTEYSKDGGPWTGGQSGGWGARTYTGLTPGSYVFRARAHNGVGDGPNTTAPAVQVLAGGYVWDGTTWKASLGVYVWNGSAWVLCQGVSVWNGSSWVAAL